MGKTKFRGIVYDSIEELEFHNWMNEAKSIGLIEVFDYHTESFKLSPPVSYKTTKQLKTKVKTIEKSLLQKHDYTPDYKITFNKKVAEQFNLGLHPFEETDDTFTVWIDIKGDDFRHSDGRDFVINQKWVYCKYGIYVNKLIPNTFYKKTWIPSDIEDRGVNKWYDSKIYTLKGEFRKKFIGKYKLFQEISEEISS